MSVAKSLLGIFGFLCVFSFLVWWSRPTSAQDGKFPLTWATDNNPARTDQIRAFNGQHPGLNLRLDYNNADIQKILLQSSSGVGPDIFDMREEQLQSYVEAGILWDITDSAKEMGFSAETAVWPTARDEFIYLGRQYSYPCNVGADIIIYNKNVFDYFGVPYPEGLLTWDAFVELARQVNSTTNPRSGASRRIFAVSGANWRVFFHSLGGEFFDEQGVPEIGQSEALRTAFQMHKDFLFGWKIMPSSMELRTMAGQGGWGAGNLNQFAAGRFAMIVTGEWSLIALARAHRQQVRVLEEQGVDPETLENPLDRPLRLGCMLIPRFADRPPKYQVMSRSAGINAHSPNREEALRFLQYLSGPEYSRLINAEADWLPGNPGYAELGVEPGPPDLERPALHAATIEAVRHGYSPRKSPFLLTADVIRVLGNQINRMESDPGLPVETLLETAHAELQTLLRRNLDRNPALRKQFEEIPEPTRYPQ